MTANIANLYAKFCEIKSRETKKLRIENENMGQIRDQRKEEILAALEAAGIPKERVETNGYSFRFSCNGMLIGFVNQTERISGEMHRRPQNREEAVLIANQDFILSQEEIRNEFCESFLYQEFCIYGDPVSAIGEIIAMASNPLAPLESAANNKNQKGSR